MSIFQYLNDYQKHILGGALADDTHSAYVLPFLIHLNKPSPSENAIAFIKKLTVSNPFLNSRLEVDGDLARYNISPDDPVILFFESNIEKLELDFDTIVRPRTINIQNDRLAQFFIFHDKNSVIGLGFLIHHIIFDAESFNIISSLCDSYFINNTLEIPSSNYTEFLPPDGIQKKRHQDFWKVQLEKLQAHKSLNINTEDSTSSGFFVSHQRHSSNLSELCIEANVSRPQIFMALTSVILSSIHRKDLICFGTVVSVRPADFHQTIGNFTNTIPLVINLEKFETIKDIAIEIKKSLMLSLRHSPLPLIDILKQMPSDSSNALNYLDSFISYRKDNTLKICDFKEGWTTTLNSKFSLNFEFIEVSDGVVLRLHGNKDYPLHFLRSTTQAIWRLANNTQKQLDDTDLFTDETLNINSSTDFKSIVTQWFENTKNQPNAIAFKSSTQYLSYSEATQFSYAVAAKLAEKKLTPHSRVALIVDRSLYFVPSLIGIWLAGHSAVPIDIRWVPDRQKQVICESAPAINIVLDNTEIMLSGSSITLQDLISDSSNLNPSNFSTDIDHSSEAYLLFTSGTTNVAKGVSISHSNISAYINGLIERLPDVQLCKTMAAVSSLAADLGYTSIFLALATGKSLSIFDYQESIDASLFANRIQNDNIDLIKIVPTHLTSLMSSYSKNTQLLMPNKFIIFGGEALHPDLIHTLKNTKPEIRIINHYGPTETTVGVLANTIESQSSFSVALGKPISSHTKIVLVDHRMRIAPASFPGEIVVLGTQVSRGYINDKNNSFRPFDSKASSYRTGDLGVYDTNDNVYFLGREDLETKIDGIRINLSEVICKIQSILNIGPISLLHDNNQLYLFQTSSLNLSIDDIYKNLFGKIDPRCIPSDIIYVNKIPTTLNGKTNFDSLRSLIKAKQSATLSSSTTDERLLNIWKIHVGPLLQESDFTRTIYHFGKNSISCLALLNKVNKVFNINLSLGKFLARPNFRHLEKLISLSNSPSRKMTNSLDTFPLTPFQKRMWLMNQIDPKTNIGLYEVVFPKEHPKSYIESIAKKVFHHFQAFQAKLEISTPLSIVFKSTFDDFFKWTPDADLANLNKDIHIDLKQSSAVLCLAKPSGFIFAIHHIISDGSSIALLFDFLESILLDSDQNGTRSHYLNRPVETDSKAITYWNERLRTYHLNEFSCDLSFDFNGSLEYLGWSYPKNVSESIMTYCLQAGISYHLFFFAAAHLSLSIIFDQAEFAHLLSLTKRQTDDELKQFGCGIENLIFLFKNNSKENLKSYLENFIAQWSEQLEHTDLTLTDQIKGTGLLDSNGNIKILHSFIFESASQNFTQFQIKTGQGKHGQGIPLVSTIRFHNDVFEGTLQAYLSENLNSTDCQMFKSFMQIIPNLLIHDPELSLATIGTSINLPSYIDFGRLVEIPNLQSHLLKNFHTYSDSPAIYTSHSAFINYSQLFERIGYVGSYLLENTKSTDRILIQLNRGIDFVATVFASILTGRCFIPVSASESADRIKKIKAVYDDHVFVIDAQVKGSKTLSFHDLIHQQIPQSLPIYTIFTSGTTGDPKGVEICYSSIANYLLWASEMYNFKESDVTALFSSLSVDLTVTSYLLPFFCGGAVFIPEFENDLEALKDITSWNGTFHLLKMTPSHLRWLKLADLGSELNVRNLVLGGEKLTYSLLHNLPKVSEIYNEYGPTETTIGCTVYKIPTKNRKNLLTDDIPIGLPVYNSSAHYHGLYGQFHTGLKKVMLTMHGECCLLNYAGSKDEPNKILNKFYPTGDFFKLTKDGPIYLARHDRQAKVQGNRIDLTAIQSVLNRYDNGHWELHLVNSTWSTDLFAVVLNPKEKIDIENINDFLLKTFPRTWLPKKYFLETDLILNKSGKIDWVAVLDKTNNTIKLNPSSKDSIHETSLLVQSWEKVLHRKNISTTVNFFDAGGDSIRILELFESLKPIAKKQFKLVDLFKYTTIESQFKHIIENPSTTDSALYTKPLPSSQINRLRLLQKGRSREYDSK